MALKTVNVIGTLYNPSGSPASDVSGYFVLNKYEKDTGVVVPTSAYFKTNKDGEFSVDIWPNARGTGASQYIVRAYTGQAVIFNAVVYVPDTDVVVNINDIMIEPPYPPVNQSLQALLEIQALVVELQASGDAAIEAAEEALESALNAYNSALLAEDWAIKMGDTVDGQEYSSKHYSQQSMAFRDESQDASATSIQHAIESAISASDSEDSAILSRDWAVKLDEPVDGIEYSAKYHANRAGASNQLAVDKAEEARISAQVALSSEQAAKTSETNSAISEQNAAISAGLAEVSSDLSRDWAIKTDGLVDGDDYSSKHYATLAQQAIAEVDVAKQAAIDAQQSAQQSADLSKDSELLAEGYKNEANASKDLAKDWSVKIDGTVDGVEYSAKYYANQAKTSEINTNDSRLAAKQSEDNAKESELAAKISEENALLSANQFDVNFTQMATAIINTQTIVVNHHGFGD